MGNCNVKYETNNSQSNQYLRHECKALELVLLSIWPQLQRMKVFQAHLKSLQSTTGEKKLLFNPQISDTLNLLIKIRQFMKLLDMFEFY